MTSLTISYFTPNQEWQHDIPSEIITIEEARARKKSGRAYFVSGTHGVMCEVPQLSFVPLDADRKPIRERGDWKVVDQTAKPGIRHRRTRTGPGRPHYALV